MKGISSRVRLVQDPALPAPRGAVWPFAHLDERLRSQGKPALGTESSAKAVEDASFDLMAPGDREALDEIRLLPRRALVEFLMYEVTDDADRRLLTEMAAMSPPLPAPDIVSLLDLQVRARELLQQVLPTCDEPFPHDTTIDVSPSDTPHLYFAKVGATLPEVDKS